MSQNVKLYQLHHEYELDEGDREMKSLGIYSSQEKAIEAIERYRTLEGFRNRPDGFVISELIVDRDSGWTEGFISWDEALKPPN